MPAPPRWVSVSLSVSRSGREWGALGSKVSRQVSVRPVAPALPPARPVCVKGDRRASTLLDLLASACLSPFRRAASTSGQSSSSAASARVPRSRDRRGGTGGGPQGGPLFMGLSALSTARSCPLTGGHGWATKFQRSPRSKIRSNSARSNGSLASVKPPKGYEGESQREDRDRKGGINHE